MTFLHYLIQVNLYLVLFYGFYRFLLANETFYNLNRIYLVGSAVLSFGIPFWYSDYIQSFFITQQVNEVFYTVLSPAVFGAKASTENPFTWYDLLKVFYIVCTFFLSIKLIFNFLQLKKILENTEDYSKLGAGFSFFNYVFVDKDLQKHEVVMEHEYVHIKQLHSADVILFEVIAVLCWFNPVVYFYKKSVKHIHEFIADDIASKLEASKADYAMLLFSQQFGLNPHQLTNQFIDKSTLKRRIEMLHKPRSRKIALLKYGFTAPLFALMLVIASASIAKNNGIKKVEKIVEKTAEMPITELSILPLKAILAERETPVKGKVTAAEDGKPLAGVSVTIKDKNIGTTTDIDGNYEINASSIDELIFTFVGLEANTIPVTDKKVINVSLKSEKFPNLPSTIEKYDGVPNNLKEVVVTGYSKNGNEIKEDVFTSVDESPTFPGGVKELYRFIGQNIKYPVAAQRANTQGKVFVRFIVRKDGSTSDMTVLKGIGNGCDEETMRVISIMPKWNAGKKDGVPVNVYFTMPVSFVLEGGEEEDKGNLPEKLTVIQNGETKTWTNKDDIKREANIINEISADGGKSIFFEVSPNRKEVTFTIRPKIPNAIPSKIPTSRSVVDDKITIKGQGKISSYDINGVFNSDDVLWVVDGIIATNDAMKQVEPQDIESISVLKNANATALYGEKGKNGVILVTTKKSFIKKEESNFVIKGKQLYTIKIGNKRQIIDAKIANDYSTDRIMQVNVVKLGDIKTRKTGLNEYEEKVLKDGYDGWVDIWVREQ